MNKDELFDSYLAMVKHYELDPGRGNLKFYLSYLFEGVSFEGSSMLDIGGGSGLFSLYGAYMGAKPVVCLEPELEGSSRGAADKLKRLCDGLPAYISIIPKAVTFQQFDSGNQTFDIILLHKSVNHLDEEACINLQSSDAALNSYKAIFSKLSKLASIDAKLVLVDCSRYNFWHRLGVRNPFSPAIEWHKHQSPKYWSKLLRDFGFANPQIRWLPPSSLRTIGKLLFGNRFISYFSTSSFCLVMERR